MRIFHEWHSRESSPVETKNCWAGERAAAAQEQNHAEEQRYHFQTTQFESLSSRQPDGCSTGFFEGFHRARRIIGCWIRNPPKPEMETDVEIMKTKALTTALFAAIGLFFTPAIRAADSPALMQPVKSVLDHYLMIQTELAKDSLKGVDEDANAFAKAVKADEMKMLSPDVAKQAETLAKAKDLKAAREAFKPLSASLVKYLADNKAGKGIYYITRPTAQWRRRVGCKRRLTSRIRIWV